MKNIILLASILFFFQTSFAQVTNINLSNGNTFDGEPFLAVNPMNPQNIVVSWMGISFSGILRVSIKTKASFDGGATWGGLHVQEHGGATFHSADVSMCFRNDGVVYICFIDYRQNPDSGGVYISKSVDGALSWSTPVEAWNLSEDPIKKPIDRPWLVCDNSSGNNKGMLYMTTKPPSWVPAPNRPYLKTSADSGQTWSSFRFVDSTGYLVGNAIQAPMAALTTTTSGVLCIAYPSYVPAQSIYPKMYLARSTNRGVNFQYSTLINIPVGVTDTNLKSGYCLAASPIDSNKLAFACVNGQNGDPDIFVSTSNDGGSTWSNLVRVNDDIIGNGIDQDLVWCSYNTTGDLSVTWRDRRNGSGVGFYQACDTYGAVSHDNGVTFNSNFLLSSATAPFDSVLTNDGNDFMSSNLIGDTIYAAWGDVRSGKLNIYFVKTSDSTGASTGIVNIASEDILFMNVFPEPATNSFTVSLSSVMPDGKLEIFDVSGKKVFQKNNPGMTEPVNCRKFSNGIYNLFYSSGEYSIHKKIMVGN